MSLHSRATRGRGTTGGHGGDVGTRGDGTLGSVLRALREDAGLSQEELAERAGLSSHAISALERGTRTRPYPHTLRSLATALDLGEDQRAALLAAVPSRTPRTTPRRPRRRTAPPAGASCRSRPRRSSVATTTSAASPTSCARAAWSPSAAPAAWARPACPWPQRRRSATATPTAYAWSSSRRSSSRASCSRLSPTPWTPPATPRGPSPTTSSTGCAASTCSSCWTTSSTSSTPRRTSPRSSRPCPTCPSWPPAGRRCACAARRSTPWSRSTWTTTRTGRPPPRRGCCSIARSGSTPAGAPTRPTPRPSAPPASASPGCPSPSSSLLPGRGCSTPGRCCSGSTRRCRPARATSRPASARCAPPWTGARDCSTHRARRLLRLMGVFVGGTTLVDLEAIAARVGIADDEVVTSLEELVEHSLVLAEGSGRLRMLEPVAQYARDLLREADEWEDAARAHAAHYLTVAETNHSSYRDGGQVAALNRIDLEHANLTAAAERSLAAGDIETPARMAWELWLYWWLRGDHDHGRRFAESRPPPRRGPARRRACPRRTRCRHDGLRHGRRPRGRRMVGTLPRARRRRPGDPLQRRGGRGPGGTRRRRPRPGPRPFRGGQAPCRGRRPRGPVDLGAGARLAGHRGTPRG